MRGLFIDHEGQDARRFEGDGLENRVRNINSVARTVTVYCLHASLESIVDKKIVELPGDNGLQQRQREGISFGSLGLDYVPF